MNSACVSKSGTNNLILLSIGTDQEEKGTQDDDDDDDDGKEDDDEEEEEEEAEDVRGGLVLMERI